MVVFNVKHLSPTPHFLGQALLLEPRLLWDSLCSPGWPEFCLCLLTAGVTNVFHHTQLNYANSACFRSNVCS